MVYKGKTLRRMPSTTRETARLVNKLDGLTRQLKHKIPALLSLEHDSRALANAKQINGLIEDEQIRLVMVAMKEFYPICCPHCERPLAFDDSHTQEEVREWIKKRNEIKWEESVNVGKVLAQDNDLPDILSYENTGIAKSE